MDALLKARGPLARDMEDLLGPDTKTTAADIARHFLEGRPIKYGRDRMLYAEMSQAYPEGVEYLFANMIKDFNAIRDEELITSLQKSIVVQIEDAAVGIKLARQVKAIVRDIRRKDKIATQLLLLHVFYDQALQNIKNQHKVLLDSMTTNERSLLTHLVRTDGNVSELSDELQNGLQLVFDCPREKLQETITKYWNATRTSISELK
jgi:hypothetical protein